MPIPKTHEFREPTDDEKADLVSRAMAGWFKTGGKKLPMDASGFQMLGGLGYVVLRDCEGVLAVYRVRSDTLLLRRMKSPPAALTGSKPATPELVRKARALAKSIDV